MPTQRVMQLMGSAVSEAHAMKETPAANSVRMSDLERNAAAYMGPRSRSAEPMMDFVEASSEGWREHDEEGEE